ncbi:hypothetical protein N7495_007721 [Penicillium taxi]|uniref:uncharacterized protein n=1 Tax=Penicillium taxi TaxID=168475 RepID=UPI002544E65F|nr:uncharacterized protein N7495_007721 [Penicillium taxi]KAJ5887680.1 hypothetical protein N7495_007721 [Penicillium taxi]
MLLRPFAFAGSSVLLCELHMFWTCATISASRLPHPIFTKAWYNLATPSFLYGMSQFLMYQMQTSMELSAYMNKPALVTIVRVIILLVLRVFALLPTTIAVIVTETSLLPENLVTIIPSRTKPRGITVAELFGGTRIPRGFDAFSNASKAFGKNQYLWLMELHLKKCFIQSIIELVTGLPMMAFGVFYSRN